MIRAVVFDLDGTLIDTEKLFVRFWQEAAREMGYPMRLEHALQIRGMARDKAEALLKETVCPEFDYHGVRERRTELMEAYIEKHGIELKPGAKELLCALRGWGIKIGLATASNLPRAERCLKATGLYDDFDAVTVAAMVKNGKPAPDIYIEAARRLGVPAEEAIGVEDAPSGIRAIHGSGLFPVLVPDQDEPGEALAALCGLIVPSLHTLKDWIGEKKETDRANWR